MIMRAHLAMWMAAVGILTAFLGANAAIAATPASPAKPETVPPNIVFLFSDDQRADTIQALGNKNISTPNVDRLVRSGTAFTRAYCMGAMQGAVCVPSRAMMMSGRTLFRVSEKLESQTTWPELFGKVGYATFAAGKWHNGAAAFTRSFQSGRSVFLGGMGDPGALPVQDFAGGPESLNKRNTAKHASEQFADEAIAFIRQQKTAKPFCLYVAFTSPHDPRIAPPEFKKIYSVEGPPLPPNYMPLHPFNNGEMKVRDETLAPWPRTPAIVKEHLADYYACISHVDAQVGRIIEALREGGLYDKTIIVYSSDHGLAIGSHGLFGKQNLYDHSMHAPLIFSGPGIPKNRQSDALCYLLDIFPTLCDLAGIPMPDSVEGQSLAPILAGTKKDLRDSIFTAYRDVQRAVRTDRWKLIRYPQINKTQLFHLAADPFELHNLADEPAQAKKVGEMMDLLRQWQQQSGDKIALTSPNPAPLQVDLTQPAEPAPKGKKK
jgi:arylsulfatase A-like enzyme